VRGAGGLCSLPHEAKLFSNPRLFEARNRAPWIFKSDVEPVEAENGAVVDVVAKGRFLGQAFYSEHSEITLRVLSRGALSDSWLSERIDAAIDFREQVLGMSGAGRLIHGESDGLPGLIVDRYGDVLVLQILAAAMEMRTPAIIDALVTRVKPSRHPRPQRRQGARPRGPAA
jgi:23S rRNA (cytosine1962-C5)-methyltransferase